MNMDYGKEFMNYGRSMGLNTLTMEAVGKHQAADVLGSNTPYVIEEREMRYSQLDVFSRMMKDRQLFITGGVDQRMADVVQAQLLFLDSVEKKDITFNLSSPGGSVLSGLGIVDVMNYVKSDIATINVGMAASMGSVILSSGAKGKRSSLIHSKVMTHYVSHGSQGNVQDTRINQIEAEKYNFILFKMLASNCGKTFDEMLESSRRDRWFNSDDALAFGLIDEVIGVDKHPTISKMMEGFDEYYQKEVLNKS